MERKAISAEQTDYRGIAACLHCCEPFSGRGKFCCMGCESAYALTHAAGITEPPAPLSALAIQEREGVYRLTLGVKGMHCASCIRQIEHSLMQEPEVISARVNMSTDRLVFSWQGTQKQGDVLAAKVAALGYLVKPLNEKESAQSPEEQLLLRCIALAGFAAGNLMLISVGLWTTTQETMGIATRDLLHWVSALIALPSILYAGQPFFRSALNVLKQGHTNMDVPISLAVLLAGGMSLFETFRHGEHAYFDSAVMLLFFLLIGRYLNERSKGKAMYYAKDLLAMFSATATVLEDGAPRILPLEAVKEGMVVLVATGEKIPADGEVMEGESALDMSLITGESLPQPVQKGMAVFAGTLNLSSPLKINVLRTQDKSLLSDIIHFMEHAGQSKARYVRLADRMAQLYTPVVHVLGFITFLFWWGYMHDSWQSALLYAITVLIITCPCALGLAVPVVQVLASSVLMRQGILLKSGDALEKLARIDVAIFDKTGTLTLGKPALEERCRPAKTHLQMAASLAAYSKHPLSRAITHAYEGALLPVTHAKETAGKGLAGIIRGKTVKLGSRSWCCVKTKEPQRTLELWLAIEGKKPIVFTFHDPLRPDAQETIARFQAAHIRPILLSGDTLSMAEKTALATGITEYGAGLSPADKYQRIEQLQAEGHRVLMVGDGLNDAPALAAASLSISPSTAMDISQNAADIIFQGKNLHPVFESWRVARISERLVKQNFLLAILYNIIAVPLAMAGYITPLAAAIAMSASSLVVIANSFRLKGTR